MIEIKELYFIQTFASNVSGRIDSICKMMGQLGLGLHAAVMSDTVTLDLDCAEAGSEA